MLGGKKSVSKLGEGMERATRVEARAAQRTRTTAQHSTAQHAQRSRPAAQCLLLCFFFLLDSTCSGESRKQGWRWRPCRLRACRRLAPCSSAEQ